MPLSVDELRAKVQQYRSNGLNTQQIADELSLSQTTIQWLSTEKYSNNVVSEDRPTDVQVGWRSVAVKASRIEAISYIFADIIEEEIGDEVDTIVGISINGIPFAQAIAGQLDLDLAVSRSISVAVKASRIEAISYIFADIIEEEIGDEVDTIVGISINGIPFAQAIAGQLDLDLAVSRSISEEEGAHISEIFANVSGKMVVVVDDVVSSGTTLKKTINNLRKAGADVRLCLVLANKSEVNALEGVPLRGLVRVVTV